MSFQTIFVIGAGAWGTALAQAAALAGRDVVLVARDQSFANEINASHCNRAYLGDRALSHNIVAQTGWSGLAAADMILMVVPAQHTRRVLLSIDGQALANKPIVLCAKGLEHGSLDRQSEILSKVVPTAHPLVLSGPSFADDVVAGRPTALTLAGRDPDLTDQIAAALAGPSFRPYAASDIVGVELAGSLKNVYALACGAVEGAGLGLSARSALMARAFAEMTRLVTRMGGEAATLTGLAGLGDLALSCTSPQSRNYWFGLQLGQGRSVEEIQQSGAKLAEGLTTAPVAQGLARAHDVDVPLIDAVNLLLAGAVSIDAIVAGLMSRPLKREGKS